MSWTPDRENLLRILWTQGLSASEIGRRLGITRNAVVAKIHRMGLPRRDTKLPRQTKAQHAKALGNSAPPLIPVDRSRETGAPRGPHNIAFKDRDESSCLLFVGGESRETGLICGRPREEGKPYCNFCCKLAYLPAEAKRRAA